LFSYLLANEPLEELDYLSRVRHPGLEYLQSTMYTTDSRPLKGTVYTGKDCEMTQWLWRRLDRSYHGKGLTIYGDI
jgi:hypothetical protein